MNAAVRVPPSVFLRLKFALLRGRFKGGWQVKLGIVLSLLVGLPTGGLLGLGLIIGGRTLDVDLSLAVVTCSVLTLGWTLGPPLLFGLDDTLDPARLTPLPLTRRDLSTGMLAASVLGVGPLVTIMILGGLFLGVVPAGPGALLVVAGVIGQFVFCIVVSRLVTTGLSDILRSRRGRDAAGVGFVLAVIVVPQLANLLVNVAVLNDVTNQLAAAARILSWTPLGWFGRAIGEGATGGLVTGAGFLALGTAVTCVCGWLWLVTLDRLVTRTPDGAGPASDRDGGLFVGRLVRHLPRTRLGAATAKELRLYARDSRLRLALFVSVGFGTVALIFTVNNFDQSPRSILGVVLTSLLLSLGGVNTFGVDGPAAAQIILAGGDHRPDLRGKHVAVALLGVPFLVIMTVSAAAVTGGWAYIPAGIIAAVGMLALGLGVGSVSSVVFPAPQPELGANAFGAAAGQNMTNGLLQSLAILIVGACLIPFGIAALVITSPVVMAIVSTVMATAAFAIWRALTRWSAARLAERAPEFLSDLQPA